MELQGQSTKIDLFVHAGYTLRVAAVHEQWPPELVLALKEAKNASGSVNRENYRNA